MCIRDSALLPQSLLLEGNGLTVSDGRIRSKVDRGPDLIRGGSSAVPDIRSASILCTLSQWNTLVTFGKTTLAGWALLFTIPNPDGGDDLLVRFGETLPTRTNLTPDRILVTFELEVFAT